MKKVFVGVSGGVDSSVSAALLKDKGYDVVGVFIRTWQPDWITCTWRDERRDAMRVCAHLEIPFVELNLEEEYKKGVADYMIAEYRKGRTPNPDVMCNREVKFGAFLTWALEKGADYVATGHYARTDGTSLLKGIDPSKDQSYFLWALTRDQLKHVLFPVGNLHKSQVRNLAQKYQLPTAAKKDSQGICFIGPVDMKEFLSHYIETNPGDVLNEKGEFIGTHGGALFYTLGERHGFVIAEKTSNDKPYYVIAKDVEKNTITVSGSTVRSGSRHEIMLADCVWREPPLKEGGRGMSCQVRYHGELIPCLVPVQQEHTQIEFKDEVLVASGQSVVLYDGDICIGGGIVE